MTDHRRKRYYGRSHKRVRRQGGGLPTAVVVLVLLLSACLLVLGLFPEARTAAGKLKEKAVSVFNSGSGGAESSGPGNAEMIPGADKETVSEVYFKATESADEPQSIVVVKETEPETEAPLKYTENENTGWIGGETSESRAGEASGAENAPLTFSFAGDILFDDRYAVMANWILRPGGSSDPENAFDPALISLMRDADVFMVNNEFPYSERGTALEGKAFTFRADPAYAGILKEIGADIVSLANNHMFDYGEEALLDTLSTLKQEGIPYVGAGEDLAEAARPYYFTNGDVKIGIVCATQIERLSDPDTRGAAEGQSGVFRCLDSSALEETIAGMKEECDFVIAYLHWGTESTADTDAHQERLAKAVVAAGADLIIGDHPHVLQKIDFVDGVPVVYSLGNYLFNSNAQDTCLVTASIDPVTAELVSLQFVPARQEGCRTKLLEGTEKKRVLDYMRSLSDVEYDEDGFIKLEK